MQGQPPPRNPAADVAIGCGLTFLLHVLAIMLMFGLLFSLSTPSGLAETLVFGLLLGFGVSQLVYMLPAIFFVFSRDRPNIGKGLIIGTAITFALSAACWALLNPEGLSDMLHGQKPRIF
jgi:hypothetical protein